MSELHDTLDLREQITRIDRAMAESAKFAAEQRKLIAEAAKLDRDRWLAPLIAIGAGIGSLIGAASVVYRLILG